jgi:preprotein translocase SecF subunit
MIYTGIVGVEYGIDFLGGMEIAIRIDKPIHTDQLRKIIDQVVKDAEIKSFGRDNQYLIRIKESTGESKKVIEELKKNFNQGELTILKEDTIGPKIGKELRGQAIIAVILAIIAMLIYIAFRFEFIYGLGAIIALIHDVIFTFSIINVVQHFGWINLEFNQQILAALLTVVGYSVNDTVIIFDRIRENKVKHKGMNFVKMINLSINETLSRTVNTVLTVVLVLLTMVVLAGPVLQGFAFTMLIGIIIGTYSSTYIASSFVIWYLEKVKKVVFEEVDDVKKPVVNAI